MRKFLVCLKLKFPIMKGNQNYNSSIRPAEFGKKTPFLLFI